MSISKCTEPVQPQAKLHFPQIYYSTQTSPDVTSYKQDSLKKMRPQKHGYPTENWKGTDMEISPGEPAGDQTAHASALEKENIEQTAISNHVLKLHYSIWYELQTEELRVSFLEGLCTSDTEDKHYGNHCYVLGILTTISGLMETRTTLIKSAPYVAWEETLLFRLKQEERSKATLTLTLRHCDQFTRQHTLGEITLSLENIHYGTTHWVDLKAPEKLCQDSSRTNSSSTVSAGVEKHGCKQSAFS
ncbi:synaptotagmin-13-like isoform X2 [Bombina bombina]|nr:synaptotagmin-13-like isoform X2 [Bombina bombina]